jgi:hypothetical protein
VPPGVASLSVIAEPSQTAPGPVIAAGNGSTVTTVVRAQPVAVIVYVIAAVPVEIPETIPVDAPIVAIAVAPLSHVPPGVASERVVVCPVHT